MKNAGTNPAPSVPVFMLTKFFLADLFKIHTSLLVSDAIYFQINGSQWNFGP